MTVLQDNVLIEKGAIERTDLAVFADYLREVPMTQSLVSNFADDAPENAVEWVVNKDIRDTQEVQLSDAIKQKLDEIVAASIRNYINKYYAIVVRDWESPHILHYGVGGHYIPHVDAETLYTDEMGRKWWEKTLDRDLSIVCFLNDDFAGGDLLFPDIDLAIKPEAGMLVCFPSDHNYVHGVAPVTFGHRYSLVTWLRVSGMPAMEVINRQTLDEYERAWPEPVSQPPRVIKS